MQIKTIKRIIIQIITNKNISLHYFIYDIVDSQKNFNLFDLLGYKKN